jgi:septal ring factor EnvC (AmiA/AmiB activator)
MWDAVQEERITTQEERTAKLEKRVKELEDQMEMAAKWILFLATHSKKIEENNDVTDIGRTETNT